MELSYYLPKILRKVFNRCAVRNSIIDRTAKLDIGSVVTDSSMGRYSYIGENTSLIHTKVGSFTSISNYCAIGGGSHPINWGSTSPVFSNSKSILCVNMASNVYNPFRETVVGNDVWIGSHCLIKAGVKINDGAVIGMGAVVTKDIGPYEIWAGNPAKLIRKRFTEDIIAELLDIQWWNLSEKDVRKYAEYFNNVEELIKVISDERKKQEID